MEARRIVPISACTSTLIATSNRCVCFQTNHAAERRNARMGWIQDLIVGGCPLCAWIDRLVDGKRSATEQYV